MLRDDIVCREDERDSAREIIMIESNTHTDVHETALSYPGSLAEQAMSMPHFLQETRIRWCMLMVRAIVLVCIRLECI
jgi:hypothetical protein